ncbi:MAG TPA: TetR/AcrR family transcriptional regulator [Acidimicrobiales bacterium]|nr:TetR/AcrR family transcriptional regulator [Acidimicrobiales bacterium]
MDKRRQQGQSTRQHLVDVATRLFAERGYEGTSVEAVLDEAGVSRGSLYHHFATKQALFEAAVDEVETRVGRDLTSAVRGAADAVDALRLGCLAWVRLAAGDPVVQRIVLIDAPAVLSWRRWREVEEEYGLGLIKGALVLAARDGRLETDLVDVFAHMVLATVNELALFVVEAGDSITAQQHAEVAVDEFLGRLFSSRPDR